MMIKRRKRGTGTVCLRHGSWVALAPQHTRGAKQLRIAKEKTRWAAERKLDAWLSGTGRITYRRNHG